MDTLIDIAKRDPKAELECKLLSGKIQTKDVADRLIKVIETVSIGEPIMESILRVSYPEDIRVEVLGSHNIQKVCATNSFKGVPLTVQKKSLYYSDSGKVDSLEFPDTYSKFTLRMESVLRKDWDVSPNDSKSSFVRILNRRSYKTIDEFFQIDISMVKTRRDKRHTLRDVLKETPIYELEIEFVKRNTDTKSSDIASAYNKLIHLLLQAYQESEFVLSPRVQEEYVREFKASGNIFVNPVTLERRHIREDRPHNILSGYTVTNKADGERSGLYVSKDRKLIRITSRTFQVTWTGLTALTDSFYGTFVDGEYIQSKNLFCIFDIYHYKGRTTMQLPLMKNDEDTTKNPLQSRLGCARTFVNEIKSHFVTDPTTNPINIETKLFLAGDGTTMELAIQKMLDMEYEYKTDGLIFTPRLSPVAPKEDRNKNTWMRVYKWKPPHQNSIDFLLRMTDIRTFDPVLNTEIRKGELYISRSSSDSILYPCETMTGEYVPKELPSDLKYRSQNSTYIPALFQPSSPRSPDAYQILIPIDDKGLAYDEEKNRIEDNTIIECAYNTEKSRWIIMRTRYDKTYAYRVLRESQYGNDRKVADNIWTSIHIPVSENMIRKCSTEPIDEESEDEYYREDLDRNVRVLQDSYTFHNKVKDIIFSKSVKEGNTLIEFGSGVGGDMLKWKRAKLSTVVGIEPSLGNLKQACTRYLKDKQDHPLDYRPAILYVQGDMTQPLYQQESDKFKILDGTEKGQTKYLEQFEGLKKFDAGSAQFVIHYACESEDTFRVFVKNIVEHCKDIFFGTCLDGKAVYTLLAGKQSHLFTNGKSVGGEYVKEYEDRESWVEEFGLPIKVSMESFETKREYLVPFEKITQIFKEEGFDLVETTLFSEIYASQQKSVLSEYHQTFSFLNRTFIFKRGTKEEPKIEKDDSEIVEIPVKKTRKLKKDGITENPVLFHGAGEDKGEFRTFSNAAEYPIQISDVKYPSVEHYFQAQKAKEFGDTEMFDKILATPSGKAVKALGKKVRNFVKEVWDDKRLEIMMRGVKAKFVQHPELQKQLLDTEDRKIGEADARDSFWGIGTSENTEKSKDSSKWKGQNRLGKILMALRDEFKQL